MPKDFKTCLVHEVVDVWLDVAHPIGDRPPDFEGVIVTVYQAIPAAPLDFQVLNLTTGELVECPAHRVRLRKFYQYLGAPDPDFGPRPARSRRRPRDEDEQVFDPMDDSDVEEDPGSAIESIEAYLESACEDLAAADRLAKDHHLSVATDIAHAAVVVRSLIDDLND
jgi:hypothetical protein